MEDPGPDLASLRDIGIEPPEAQPAGVREQVSNECSDTDVLQGTDLDEDTSDDENIWWSQPLHGGTMLRDGDSPDSVSTHSTPPKDGEASRTPSPAAAASRRSVPRMPLQSPSAPMSKHREKERRDLQYFYNPFTDYLK